MNHRLIFILLLLAINGCNMSNFREAVVYEWHSYPSFHEGFSIELSEESNQLIFTKHNKYLFLADSIEPDVYYKPMDSIRIQSIKNLIPKETQITKTISKQQSEKIKDLFTKLFNCKEEDSQPGPDGITFIFTKTKNKKLESECKYWTPKEGVKGIFIKELISTLFDIYENDLMIVTSLENSYFYLEDQLMFIKNLHPLYIKIIYLSLDCESMKKEIDELPDAEEIFVDLTNYQGENMECYTDNLYAKYKKVRWIKANFKGGFTNVFELIHPNFR